MLLAKFQSCNGNTHWLTSSDIFGHLRKCNEFSSETDFIVENHPNNDNSFSTIIALHNDRLPISECVQKFSIQPNINCWHEPSEDCPQTSFLGVGVTLCNITSHISITWNIYYTMTICPSWGHLWDVFSQISKL